MSVHPGQIEFPRRYAFAALKGKIFEWFRKHPVTEITVGIGSDLEQWIGLDRRAPLKIEQSTLLEQLRMKLGERDRQMWLATVMRYHIKPVVARLGIQKRVSWHTFRRTYATLLKANGEDVKVVHELLRHGSSRGTLDVYAQAQMPAKRAAQQKVVEMVRTHLTETAHRSA